VTASVLSPDLQRIVEALKACRDDLAVQYFGDGPDAYLVTSQAHGQVFRGTVEDCSAYIDARCAEAMVRAIREPSVEMLVAGGDGIEGGPGANTYNAGVAQDEAKRAFTAMCDAILGETQP
jgi:hypothetical protein